MAEATDSFPRPLYGRHGLVSGASSGIGRATVRALARAGAAVVATGRDVARLRQLQEDAVGAAGGVNWVARDLLEPRAPALVLEAASKILGGAPDLLVVSSGAGLPGCLMDSDEGRWRSTMKINFDAALLLLRHAIRRAGPGRPLDLIVVGSNAGRHVDPESAIYGASKAALAYAVECLRRDVCASGTRVCLIEPGVVETPFFEVSGHDLDHLMRNRKRHGTLLSAEDVARAVVFVASQPPHVNIDRIGLRPTAARYP